MLYYIVSDLVGSKEEFFFLTLNVACGCFKCLRGSYKNKTSKVIAIKRKENLLKCIFICCPLSLGSIIKDGSQFPDCEPNCLHCCRFQSSCVTVGCFVFFIFFFCFFFLRHQKLLMHNSTNNPEMHQNSNYSHQRDLDVVQCLLKTHSIHDGPCAFIFQYL